MTSRNLLVARSLVSVASSLCQVLDVKSWFIVLETMQKVESVIVERLQLNGLHKTRGQKDKPTFNLEGLQQIINFEELKQKVLELRSEQAGEESKRPLEEGKQGKTRAMDELGEKKPDSAPTADLQSLLDEFDKFFVNSMMFDLQPLAELICALAQLTVGALEHLKYSG